MLRKSQPNFQHYVKKIETQAKKWVSYKKANSTRKKRRSIKQIEKSVIKMEDYKISKSLKDLTGYKFVTKQLVEVNDLSSGQYFVNKNIKV